MKIVIAGAGEVGSHAAEVLSHAGHSVTVIDRSAERLRTLDDKLDVRTLLGRCANLDVLREAGTARCGLMIAATDVDEVNLLTASWANALGAKKTFVRVHHTENFSLRHTPFAARLGVDELICPEHLTSLAIARMVRTPTAIAIEEFGRGQVAMQRIPVQDHAPSVGKRLLDVALPAGTRVAMIERPGRGASNGETFIADAHSAVMAGDVVTLVGEAKSFDVARRLFNKGKPTRKHVAVMGEGSTAVWLCRALKSRVFSVRLFVETHGRAEELAGKLGHVTILEADPLDPDTFLEEHISDIDAFIATTDDDERNIMACANAKSKGVTIAIAVVYRSTYVHVLPYVGVDYAFSPRSAAVKAIQNLINNDPVRTIAALADGIAEVYEVRPSSKAKVLGHELRHIKLPEQAMIVARRRGDAVCVPGAENTVAAGDTLLILARAGTGRKLKELFVHK